MWIEKVKYWTREGLFFFFLNTLIILDKKKKKKKKHHWNRMMLIYILSFDFINFVKEFLKNLELYPKFWFH